MPSETTLISKPEDRINELTDRLNKAEQLVYEIANLLNQTAPPRVATRLLMQVRDYAGACKFDNEVLYR